jgi:hypothetical protein
MADHTLGDAPVETRYQETMRSLAQGVDRILNGDEKPKKNGFILMIFPLNDHGGRCNYMSNAMRDDVVVLLKEQLARFEGMPEATGRA